MPYLTPDERKNRRSAALVCGFGATAAMWTAGYFARLPAVNAPGEFLFVVADLKEEEPDGPARWVLHRYLDFPNRTT